MLNYFFPPKTVPFMR